ncbi:hypothetical protein Pan181_20000 [Aeoliella mucimassa]|uniref:Uncharacterized protein n=1 Tax=Aeoliella mucimassa TaxID=2527972 RepID=A0A518AM57_9BACT|nr:hypothetical protein Pan181_20000 [Aeoliella mucimassa]
MQFASSCRSVIAENAKGCNKVGGQLPDWLTGVSLTRSTHLLMCQLLAVYWLAAWLFVSSDAIAKFCR